MDAEAAMELNALPDDLLVHIFDLIPVYDYEEPLEQARWGPPGARAAAAAADAVAQQLPPAAPLPQLPAAVNAHFELL